MAEHHLQSTRSGHNGVRPDDYVTWSVAMSHCEVCYTLWRLPNATSNNRPLLSASQHPKCPPLLLSGYSFMHS